MRNGQNKRMRGRNRRGHNPLTRAYESNGPDVKIRGTAHHIAEKYVQLARDAQASGDPVASESYLQHAEHYFRLIAAAQAQLVQQNPHQPPFQRSDMDSRDDYLDEGDDSGMNEQPYAGGAPVAQMQRSQPQPGSPQPNLQEYSHGDEGPRDIGLPAFITGGDGNAAGEQANGFDAEQGERNERNERNERSDRFGRRRRRFRSRGQNDQEQRADGNGEASGIAPATEGQSSSDLSASKPGE